MISEQVIERAWLAFDNACPGQHWKVRERIRAAIEAALQPDAKGAIKDSDVARLVGRLQADDAWQQDEEFYIAPLLHEASDAIVRLSAELAEARAERDRAIEHAQNLIDASEQECACGYDTPDDVCLGHLPKIKKLESRATAAEAERDRLRHENDCLQAQVQQKDYPCSPHCEGYLRELQLRRAALGEKADG